jgi:hypothetical protein
MNQEPSGEVDMAVGCNICDSYPATLKWQHLPVYKSDLNETDSQKFAEVMPQFWFLQHYTARYPAQ